MKTFLSRNMFLALFYMSFVVAILFATTNALASEPLGAVVSNESFYGQLFVALIAAMPPTGMMIAAFISLKRGQITSQQNQASMATALDGKLDKLMAAEKSTSKAEGIAEERERVVPTLKVEVVNETTSPVPVASTKPK